MFIVFVGPRSPFRVKIESLMNTPGINVNIVQLNHEESVRLLRLLTQTNEHIFSYKIQNGEPKFLGGYNELLDSICRYRFDIPE